MGTTGRGLLASNPHFMFFVSINSSGTDSKKIYVCRLTERPLIPRLPNTL